MRQLKKKILFSLSDGAVFLQPTDKFFYLTYSQLYWRLMNYQQVSVRGGVRDLITGRLVSKLIRSGKVSVRLTKIGRDHLRSLFVPENSGKVWDGGWRLVIFDSGKMTQKQQRWLRRFLLNSGYVMMEKGLYISSFPTSISFKKELGKMKLLNRVRVLQTCNKTRRLH